MHKPNRSRVAKIDDTARASQQLEIVRNKQNPPAFRFRTKQLNQSTRPARSRYASGSSNGQNGCIAQQHACECEPLTLSCRQIVDRGIERIWLRDADSGSRGPRRNAAFSAAASDTSPSNAAQRIAHRALRGKESGQLRQVSDLTPPARKIEFAKIMVANKNLALVGG